jgi:glycine cleavage system regulatory protein
VATASTLRRLLEATSVPDALIEEVLGEAGTPWLMGAADEVVAAETVLCHPPLAPGEVRAVAGPTEQDGVHRLTVVAGDRAGLLADTAGVLAGEGLSILDATTTVLPASRLAMQRIAVSGGVVDDDGWARLGAQLRAVLGAGAGGGVAAAAAGGVAAAGAPRPWRPAPPVTVETQPQEAGQVVVTVRAPDRPGLLHAIASWITAAGCNIEACHASTDGTTATDVLVVRGDLDPPALATALGGEPARDSHGGFFPVRIAVGTAVGLTLLPWRAAGAIWGELRGHR